MARTHCRSLAAALGALVLTAAACGSSTTKSAPRPATRAAAHPATGTSAPKIVTWALHSRFVDPAKVALAPPPPGIAARTPALRVNVYLPAGYDGVRRFPVLYLLGGALTAYDYWVSPHYGDLLHTIGRFDGIIVMPETGSNGFFANWWNGGRGGNPAWDSFYVDELIPYVGRHLAVLPQRRDHAIAGLSMGGDGAVYLASRLPGYFGSAASFSGTLDIQRPEWEPASEGPGLPLRAIFGDPRAQERVWAAHNPTKLVATLVNTRVYVTVGNGVPQTAADRAQPSRALAEIEARLQARDFVAAARAAHVAVTYREHGGTHDWPYWRQDLIDAIRWGLFR